MSSKGFKCITNQMNIVPFGEAVTCSSFCHVFLFYRADACFQVIFKTFFLP